MKKRIIVAALLACLAPVASMAAEKVFTYVGKINLGPHPTAVRAVSLAGDADGGLYFTDNGTDDVYYIVDPIATVSQTADATNIPTVGNVSFGSGSSWQSVSVLGGNILASGRTSTGPATVAAKISRTAPATFTFEELTGISAVTTGAALVSGNSFVAADATSGALQFFTVSGSTATASGSPIAGDGTGVTRVVYDSVGGKIYGVQTGAGFTRKVLVWNSNGTPGGTTYSAGSNPFVASLPSGLTATDFNTVYGQIEVSGTHGLLVVPFQQAQVGGTAGWAVYNLAAASTTTPLTVLDLSDTPDGAVSATTGTSRTLGTAFFSKNGNDYLALGFSGRGIEIYQVSDPVVNTSANSWSLYE